MISAIFQAVSFYGWLTFPHAQLHACSCVSLYCPCLQHPQADLGVELRLQADIGRLLPTACWASSSAAHRPIKQIPKLVVRHGPA